MLTIKLARHGKKNQPFFHLIIQEKARDPQGNVLEDLGYWNPLTKNGSFKKERILYWISKGAQLTPTVNNLLISQSIIQGKKLKVTKKHVPVKIEKKPEAKIATAPEETKTEAPAVAES